MNLLDAVIYHSGSAPPPRIDGISEKLSQGSQDIKNPYKIFFDND